MNKTNSLRFIIILIFSLNSMAQLKASINDICSDQLGARALKQVYTHLNNRKIDAYMSEDPHGTIDLYRSDKSNNRKIYKTDPEWKHYHNIYEQRKQMARKNGRAFKTNQMIRIEEKGYVEYSRSADLDEQFVLTDTFRGSVETSMAAKQYPIVAYLPGNKRFDGVQTVHTGFDLANEPLRPNGTTQVLTKYIGSNQFEIRQKLYQKDTNYTLICAATSRDISHDYYGMKIEHCVLEDRTHNKKYNLDLDKLFYTNIRGKDCSSVAHIDHSKRATQNNRQPAKKQILAKKSYPTAIPNITLSR